MTIKNEEAKGRKTCVLKINEFFSKRSFTLEGDPAPAGIKSNWPEAPQRGKGQ